MFEVLNIGIKSVEKYHKLYLQHSIEEDYKKSETSYNKLDSKWTTLNSLEANLQRVLDGYIMVENDDNISKIKNSHDSLYEVNFDSIEFLSGLNSSELKKYYSVFENLYNQEKEKHNVVENIVEIYTDVSNSLKGAEKTSFNHQ